MAFEVVEDLIEGHQMADDQNGLSAVRVFHVSGVEGNRPERIFRAMRAGGIPQRGEAYPGVPDMVVVRLSATPNDHGNVRVLVEYKVPNFEQSEPDDSDPSKAQLSVETSLVQVKTEKDSKGNQIKFPYQYPADATDPTTGGPDPLAGQTKDFTGAVDIMVPQVSLVFSRKEPASPKDKGIAFAGRINKVPVFGDPKHFWLCTRIGGSTTDGGKSYDVVYTFQRNSESWDPVVVALDPRTGLRVENVDPLNPGQDMGNGIRRVQVYEEADFNQLALDFSAPRQTFGILGSIFGAGLSFKTS